MNVKPPFSSLPFPFFPYFFHDSFWRIWRRRNWFWEVAILWPRL
jgi:hypothetical protein